MFERMSSIECLSRDAALERKEKAALRAPTAMATNATSACALIGHLINNRLARHCAPTRALYFAEAWRQAREWRTVAIGCALASHFWLMEDKLS